MFRHAHSNKNSGQLLIELLVALSILTTGFFAVLGLLSRSIGLNRVVSDSYIATYLAAEGIEVARNIFDINSAQGLPWDSDFNPGTYNLQYDSLSFGSFADIYLKLDQGVYGYDSGADTKFKRRIEIRDIVDPTGTIYGKRVNSIVDWSGRGINSSVNLEDQFLHWTL